MNEVNEIKETNSEKETNEQPLAMDMLQYIRKVSKFWIVFACVAFATLTIALSALLAHQMNINYKNNCNWQKLFSEYDYISQDGEGVNNINSGTQGDITNIPETE